MNTYDFEEEITEKSSSRRVSIRASNEAVGTLVNRLPFGSITSSPPLRRTENQNGTTIKSLPTTSDDSQGPEDEDIESSEYSTAVVEEERKLASLDIDRLFTDDHEHGVIPSKPLRDYIKSLDSKTERQSVFIIMYVWAYYERHKSSSSRDSLVSGMKSEGIYDTNSPKHIANAAKDYFKVDSNGYQVHPYHGVEKVEEIINAIQNPKQSSNNSETKKNKRGRPSGQINKKELEKVKPWIEQEVDRLDTFDTRKLSNASKWGAFGLYILTKVLKVEDAVEAGVLYTYLVTKFSTVHSKRRTFVERMRKAESTFSKNAKGKYFLTEKAENEMRALINGSK